MKIPYLVCATLWFASVLPAEDLALTADASQARVEYTLGDVLHTVHGHFSLKHGSLSFDPATGKASGELVVDAASGDSGSGARDRRMHKDVLESGRYPEIRFRPDRVDGRLAPQGISQVMVHGVFSIHGADHEITAPAQVEVTGSNYRVKTQFDVPYAKWGMKNPSTLFLRVSDRVAISVETVFHPTPELSQR